MKSMLKYYFKERLSTLLIITGILCGILTIYLSSVTFVFKYDYWISNEHIIKYEAINSPLGWITFYACVLATVIPIFEFKFKMDKLSVDLFYQLPISKRKLYLSKYIVGLIEVIIPIIASLLVSLIFILVKQNMFILKWFFIYAIAIIFLSIILYTTFIFIYTRCNTMKDGILNMAYYVFLFVAISSVIYNLIEKVDVSFYFLYSPIVSTGYVIDNLFCGDEVRNYDFLNYKIGLILFISIAIIFTILLFVTLIKKEKAEDSMQISNTIFGFNTLIPIITASLCFILNGESVLIALIIAALAYFLYAIQLRTLKIGKKYVLTLILTVIISFIIGLFI